jgi:hypothetical protein
MEVHCSSEDNGGCALELHLGVNQYVGPEVRASHRPLTTLSCLHWFCSNAQHQDEP